MSTSKHPKGLYLIFATSTAERFSYYGMRAIFILFLTQALLFDKEYAASIYGSYTGLVYLTPLIGGYIADKYWGIRRSVFWGAIMMALGQFLMFCPTVALADVWRTHLPYIGKRMFQTYGIFPRGTIVRTGRQTVGLRLYHILYGRQRRLFPCPAGMRLFWRNR